MAAIARTESLEQSCAQQKHMSSDWIKLRISEKNVRFQVQTAVLMLVFQVVMSCGLVCRHRRFRGTYCLHFRAKIITYLDLKGLRESRDELQNLHWYCYVSIIRKIEPMTVR
jgi:hypothetical protein